MGSRSSGRAWASMRQSYTACMDGSQMQERQAQPLRQFALHTLMVTMAGDHNVRERWRKRPTRRYMGTVCI
jgi:hypothetical protein